MSRTRPEPAAPDALERLDLSAHASSATLARRFISQFARHHALRGEVVDQLVLAGCELVTNAVLHARTELSLILELFADRIRVSVRDQSGTPVALRHYRPEALTDRGLALVSAVSSGWGVDRDGAGKRIWAEIDRTAGRRRSAAAAHAKAPRAPHRTARTGADTRAVRSSACRCGSTWTSSSTTTTSSARSS
jgi:hypothetical protein